MAEPKILIVDDHAIIRECLRLVIHAHFPAAHIGEASSGEEAIGRLRSESWDVVLLDVGLPDINGIDVLRTLKSLGVIARVLVLSAYAEDLYAVHAIRAGAAGYITKTAASVDLTGALRTVLDGGRYISSTVAEQLVEEMKTPTLQSPHERLSERERDVLVRLGSGMAVSQIATQLKLSVKTISTYRSRVLEKLGMSNNAELIHYVLTHDIGSSYSSQLCTPSLSVTA